MAILDPIRSRKRTEVSPTSKKRSSIRSLTSASHIRLVNLNKVKLLHDVAPLKGCEVPSIPSQCFKKDCDLDPILDLPIWSGKSLLVSPGTHDVHLSCCAYVVHVLSDPGTRNIWMIHMVERGRMNMRRKQTSWLRMRIWKNHNALWTFPPKAGTEL